MGHLFQGRFKSILVENETHLLRLSHYIHRNPLRAGLVNRLVDYKWSSYPAYAYKRTQYPDWLKTDFILSKFSSEDRHRSYRIQAQNYSDESQKIWEEVKHGVIYGSDRFIGKIKSKFLKSKSEAELPQLNRFKKDIVIDKLIDQASQLLNTDLTAHKITRYSPHELKETRNTFIYYLKTHTFLSNQKIGDKFDLSYSAVSKIYSNIQAEAGTNKRIQRIIEHLDSQLKILPLLQFKI